jgi:hypothetical protein
VLDACTMTIACAPRGSVDGARFTFMIARHAVVDLSYTFHAQPLAPDPERLPPEDLTELLRQLREAGLEPAHEEPQVRERSTTMRGLYEPYVNALAGRLELRLPQWLVPESLSDNWRTTEWH